VVLIIEVIPGTGINCAVYMADLVIEKNVTFLVFLKKMLTSITFSEAEGKYILSYTLKKIINPEDLCYTQIGEIEWIHKLC